MIANGRLNVGFYVKVWGKLVSNDRLNVGCYVNGWNLNTDSPSSYHIIFLELCSIFGAFCIILSFFFFFNYVLFW